MGLVVGAILAIFQRDVKRFIAFSSVCHINFMVFSLYLKLVELKLFSILIIFSHAILSSLMFWFGGLFYHLLGSRYLGLLQGAKQLSLAFNCVFFLFLLGNFGVPPFISFFSELVFVLGSLGASFILFFFLVVYLVLSCYFSVFLFNLSSKKLSTFGFFLFSGEEIGFFFFTLFGLNLFVFMFLFYFVGVFAH